MVGENDMRDRARAVNAQLERCDDDWKCQIVSRCVETKKYKIVACLQKTKRVQKLKKLATDTSSSTVKVTELGITWKCVRLEESVINLKRINNNRLKMLF